MTSYISKLTINECRLVDYITKKYHPDPLSKLYLYYQSQQTELYNSLRYNLQKYNKLIKNFQKHKDLLILSYTRRDVQSPISCEKNVKYYTDKILKSKHKILILNNDLQYITNLMVSTIIEKI